MLARLFIGLQYLLPRHMLTALIYRVARIRTVIIKDFLIRSFVRLYRVDIAEIAREVPRDFRTFNDFFTRELADGARPIDQHADAIVSPADGTVSVAARIDADSMIQAKGIHYSLDELFVTDLDASRQYSNGSFTTIYLAPYNYHRVHMPVDGKLLAADYVPGDLFSVNDSTVALLPGLFRRNERLIMHFSTARGPAALIFVGALNVGSITTPWTGEIRPRRHGVVERQNLGHACAELKRGDLLGWFNMGSTVILLLPAQIATWHSGMTPGKTVRTGECIGTLSGKPV